MVKISEEHQDDSRTHEFVSVGHVLSRRFELVREIARGGMGVVFEAGDTVLDDRRVAIKVLPAELSSNKAARTRLKREALAAIDLTHRNITRLHSYEEDGPHAYLVMELLGGETLEDVLATHGPLEVAECLEVARAAGAALALAHEKGVIHRDVKPANLMYSSAGEDRVLKVMDFGIAFRIRESLTRLTGLVPAGTLLYCPPEQLRNEKADARSDQYSLAATLYELLSGEPPFPPPGIEHKVLHVDATPLEAVPEHVDRALRTALAKHPDERFEDVATFLRALEGEVAVAEPSSVHLARAATVDLAGAPASTAEARPGGSWLPWAITGVSLALATASLSGRIDLAPSGVASVAPSPTADRPPTTEPARSWPRIETAPAALGERFVSSVGGEMQWVSPGRFRMGSREGTGAFANQLPSREVEVRTGFWLGRYEVTQREFRRVLGSSPSHFPGDERPVDSVLWNDARRFCRHLTRRDRAAGLVPEGWEYRLPTEAQWEYACRAGTAEPRYLDDLDAIAWYQENSEKQTQFVGKKLANAWGFHDMIGNVWEYTQDRWHDTLEGAPADERPWDDGDTHLRAIRGGSWNYDAATSESASRGRPHSGFRIENVGFRVALVPVALPRVPPEVTVRIRSTPPGARVDRPGLPGTLGRVGVLDQPLRLSLPVGTHPFEFKVFNRKRRRIDLILREEDLDEEVGFWAILDAAPEAEGVREERLEAELRLSRAETALVRARLRVEEARAAFESGRRALRTGGLAAEELERLRAAATRAEEELVDVGSRHELAEQTLQRATRGHAPRVPVVFTSTPGGKLENLDRWGEAEHMGFTWDRPRHLLRPGPFVFRVTRRRQEGEPRYLPRVVEVEVTGTEELAVHLDLEPEPAGPAGTQAGEVRHNGSGMRLVWVPEDGSDAGFWIGAHEVTRSEYQRVLGVTVDTDAPFRHPVDDLTFDEAREFCHRLTERAREAGVLAPGWAYRLPQVSEWERARDAGSGGWMREQLPGLAWLAENSGARSHQVGTRAPNAWGIHDALGNAAEWCGVQPGSLLGGSYATSADAILSGALPTGEEPGARRGGLRVVLGPEAASSGP